LIDLLIRVKYLRWVGWSRGCSSSFLLHLIPFQGQFYDISIQGQLLKYS